MHAPSFSGGNNFPVFPVSARAVKRLLVRAFIGAAVIGAAAYQCLGSASLISPDAVCQALGSGEGCTWSVVRRIKFRFAVQTTDGVGSSFVLSRGRSVLGAGPLPGELGPVNEEDLLALGQLTTRARYVMGSDDLQAAVLAIGRTSGVAYVADVYAVRVGDGTESTLGTALTGKLVIEVAQ